MNLIWSKYRSRGFTVLDLIIVLATVVLVVLLLPIFASRSTQPAGRVRCMGNLKQIGLAFRLWAGDHGEKFPMTVPIADGGTSEFLSAAEVFRHFASVSNEMNNAKVLACPRDNGRTQKTNFVTLNNGNVSYFVGLDAKNGDLQMILSGDRNISTNGRLMSGILMLASTPPLIWTKDIHVNCGNIGLADGSAQQVTDATLLRQINLSTNVSARVDIP
jgi:hypothetical protein